MGSDQSATKLGDEDADEAVHGIEMLVITLHQVKQKHCFIIALLWRICMFWNRARDREVVLKQVIFYAIYVFVQRTLIHLWLQTISGRARGGISRRVAALFAAAGVGAAACTAPAKRAGCALYRLCRSQASPAAGG